MTTTDEQQQAAEDEIVDLVARLVRAAADIRGHSPSRKASHGVCIHCAASRQGSAFVAMMREREDEDGIISTDGAPIADTTSTEDRP